MNPQDFQDSQPMQGPQVINPTGPAPVPPAPSFPQNPPQPFPQVAPQDMFQPIVPSGPSGDASAQPMPHVQPITNLSAKSTKKSKKPLIFGGVILLVLVGITVGAIALGGGKKSQKPTTDTTATTQQGPQPAQAIDVEQASNSISQDVSGHDNNKDFPSDELDDKTHGL